MHCSFEYQLSKVESGMASESGGTEVVMDDMASQNNSEMLLKVDSANPVLRENALKYPQFNRFRMYPSFAKGPYIVYVRQREKPINVLLISAELHKCFKTVKLIEKVSYGKLKVVFSDFNDANQSIQNEMLCKLYRVYIPSSDVEIDGVVEEAEIDFEHVVENGNGTFKDGRLKPVRVLECQRLVESIPDMPNNYVLSRSFRVTFEGIILPAYLEIDHVLIPVRLFTPKVMSCAKCHRLGHTEKMCNNKARCGRCGESHDELHCEVPKDTCFACKGVHMDARLCPIYKTKVKTLKNKVVNRSKTSYAQIVTEFTMMANGVRTNNFYDGLSDDETGNDDFDENQAHCSYIVPVKKRKVPKRATISTTTTPSIITGVSDNGNTFGRNATTDVKNKSSPPNINSTKHFPALANQKITEVSP